MKKSDIEHILFNVGGYGGYDKFALTVHKNGTASLVHESVGGASSLPNDLKLTKAETNKLLSAFENLHVFSWKRKYEMEYEICDGVYWNLEVQRQGKRKFIREGNNVFPPNWNAFCRLFGMGMDEIKLITLDLQLQNLVLLPAINGQKEKERNYSEKLIIDYENDKLFFQETDGSTYKITKDFYAESGLDEIAFCIESALNDEWNDSDKFEAESCAAFYELNVVKFDGSLISHRGIYDRNHLPQGWIDVMDSINNFIDSTGNGVLLNTHAFSDVKGKDDLTFYSVEIDGIDNSYYYFSDDHTLKIGDRVTVPFGRDNSLHSGEIVNIKFFPPDNLPFPIEKMKNITEKADTTALDPVGQRKVQSEINDSYFAHIPTEYRDAHNHSSLNRSELERSNTCACFYCKEIFNPNEINEWVDENENTALCPYCGIDSIIGDASGISLTKDFIDKMYHYWF